MDTGIDLTTASSLYIAFKTPSGITGVWEAEAVGTKAFVEVDSQEMLNEAGVWLMQVSAVFDDEVAYGRIVNVRVCSPFVVVTPPPATDEVVTSEEGDTLTDENGNILIPE